MEFLTKNNVHTLPALVGRCAPHESFKKVALHAFRSFVSHSISVYVQSYGRVKSAAIAAPSNNLLTIIPYRAFQFSMPKK